MSVVAEKNTNTVARWSLGGVFLEALANRNYARMAATLGPTVHFRAMLPPGPMDLKGPEAVADAFRSWFGNADDFELVDATETIEALDLLCSGFQGEPGGKH